MNFRRSLSAAATLALGIALSGCGGEARHKVSPSGLPAAMPVSVATVTPESLPQFAEGIGSVEARTESVIAARVMGYIQQIPVREGDHVRAGQLLAEIAATELDAAVAQARAAAQEAQSASAEVEGAIAAAESAAGLAETTLARMRNLHERRSISDQEFDEAMARHTAAQAHLRMARTRREQVSEKIRQAAAAQQAAEAQLSYLRITAPFAGVVSARLAEPGSLASPGMPLLRLEQAGAYRLAASFPESVLGSLKTGQALPVSIDALGWETEGRVAEVAPIVDAATRTVTVKVALPPHPAVRSGLYGKAKAPAGVREMLRLPSAAVRSSGQLHTVFVAADAVARSRMVKLGEERDGMREVLSGLSGGELVILQAPAGLRDGAPVEVRP